MTCREAVKKTCAAVVVGAMCAVVASFIGASNADDYVWEDRSEHPRPLPGTIPLFNAHA